MSTIRKDPNARFWSKVAIAAPDECWVWQAGRNPAGYGMFPFRKSAVAAHRYAYEHTVGPIPDGLVIDHLCRNRACVNPAHLEPVTHRVNIHRGVSVVAVNAAKTHCKWGHEFTPENTVPRDFRGRQGRECLACREERNVRRRETYPRVGPPPPRDCASCGKSFTPSKYQPHAENCSKLCSDRSWKKRRVGTNQTERRTA